MDMGQEPEVNKTAFAHFYYFPREDHEKFINLKSKLLSNFISPEKDIAKDFVLQTSQKLLIEKQLVLDSEKGLIEIYLGLTKSLTIVGVVHQTEVPDNGLTFIDDAQKIEDLIENEFETKIGTTIFYIKRKSQKATEDIDQIKQIFNIRILSGKCYVATLFGVDASHFVSIEGNYNHLYLLNENGKNKDMIKGIVESDIAIQRIRREAKFYSERRDTFMSENQDMDRSINSIFYKQMVSGKDEPDYIEIEKELNNTSKMYGIIASNLHLLEESTLNLSSDIHKIHLLGKRYKQDEDENNIFTYYKNRYQKYVDLFDRDKMDMRTILKNTRTAIDLLQARIELFRGKETVGLQRDLVALQVAAGVIEFVVIFYYSIKSWEAVTSKYVFETISSIVKIFSVTLFSVSIVTATHFFAESVKHKKINSKLIIFIVLAIISLAIMMFFSLTVKGK